MNIEAKAHEIASQSMQSYMDDEQPLSEEVFTRVFNTLYDAALKTLLEEENQ